MNDKISNTGTQTVYLRGTFGETIKLEPGQSIDPPASTLQSVTDAVDVALPTAEQIDAVYRDVWSTIPHAKRLTVFAQRIAIQAVMAERERCAEVCDGYLPTEVYDPEKGIEERTTQNLAAAIRAQPEPKA